MDIVQLAHPVLTRRQRFRRVAAVAALGAFLLAVWEVGAWYAQRPRAHHPIVPFVMQSTMPPAVAAVALTERDVEVDGIRIHYAEGGSGPPVVLCHGWMDNHRVWFRNLEVLAAGAHVYALDWPGFGLSDKPADAPYDPAYQVRMLTGFLDALGLDRISLVGHSMGGHWTTLFLLEHPERVDRYVGVASAAMVPGPPAYRLPVARWGVGRYLRWRAGRPDRPAAATAHWERLLVGSEPITPDFLAAVSNFDTRGDPGSVPTSAAALTGILRTPLRLHAHRVTTPTLLIWGDRDRVLPLRHGRRLARTLPNARLLVMEGVGHAPFVQEPERFNAAVIEFLELDLHPTPQQTKA